MRSVLKRSEAQQARFEQKRQSMFEQLQQTKVTQDFVRQMPRRWKSGDVYAPHDLSPEEMAKWRKSSRPKVDVIDMLGLNPLDEYKVSPAPVLGVAGRFGGPVEELAFADICRLFRTSPSSPSS